MKGRVKFNVLIILILNAYHYTETCDDFKSPDQHEGNQAESALQPWLGVLRVHIHEGRNLKVALTGAVLVKEKVALVSANDLANVPLNVFKQDSKLMFMPKTGEPWSCQLKTYILHPEYEYNTRTTLGIVLLDYEDTVPVKPICWPDNFFNTKNELYVFGYTDENLHLEKEMHKMTYVENSVCDEFYHRSGFSEREEKPTHYVCGFATNSRNNCMWENGMVLASNSTGRWTMIGLSIRGPGCTAPTRFIDFFSYMPWIESSTSAPVEMYYYDSK